MVLTADAITGWLFSNIYIIAAVGIIGYYAYYMFRIKKTYKIINRSEVERLKFIERMSQNKVQRKTFLLRGKSLLGEVTHYKEFLYKTNPRKTKLKEKEVKNLTKEQIKEKVESGELVAISQMVVKSPLVKSIPVLNRIFHKPKAFHINEAHLEFQGDTNPAVIRMRPTVFLDYLFGIFYDESLTKIHTQIIKNDNVIRTDLENMASIYFTKAQEQCTFDPAYAHQMALRQAELQIELARKQTKQSSVGT